jgi:ATP-binding cassette subfamily C protein
MLQALHLVDAGGLIRRLEHGLDTRIGERGVLISAGERQRLALARALLRRPTLLVLDEATNAIDVESERRILERLSSLGATILMAAHRVESLAFCDYVLQFPEGILTPRRSAPVRLEERA